jgi:hypothetical protein
MILFFPLFINASVVAKIFVIEIFFPCYVNGKIGPVVTLNVDCLTGSKTL